MGENAKTVFCQLDFALGTERLLEDDPHSLGAAVLAEDVPTLRALPGDGFEETSDSSSAAKAVTAYHESSVLSLPPPI